MYVTQIVIIITNTHAKRDFINVSFSQTNQSTMFCFFN